MSLHTKQSGNAVVVVLVILVIAAVGALAYLAGQKEPDAPQVAQSAENVEVAEAGEASIEEDVVDIEPPAQLEIKPGNPTVAKFGDEEIKRLDVLTFMQTLPPQTRQLPLQQLFPLATNQVVNTRIIEKKAASVNLDNDPEVKRQLEDAKKQIVQTVYLQNTISAAVTDAAIEEGYKDYVAGFESAEEVKASHILVEDEALAKDIIAKLIETGDFAALAKEHSTDATSENGGDLGYFLKVDVVPEFAEAAFGMEPGTYTKDPVKTQFGYHIIRVEDKRMREAPTLEQVKPFIEANLRKKILQETLDQWRAEANIEVFDVNGETIEPAAGEETPEEKPAE